VTIRTSNYLGSFNHKYQSESAPTSDRTLYSRVDFALVSSAGTAHSGWDRGAT
jgi:hypothetical protein